VFKPDQTLAALVGLVLIANGAERKLGADRVISRICDRDADHAVSPGRANGMISTVAVPSP
jgi:hypothetical protein